MLRKQSKCGVIIQKGEGASAKILAEITKSEAFIGSAHSEETIKRKANLCEIIS